MLSIVTITLTACSSNKKLENAQGISGIRAQAIRDTAHSFSAQYGLALRSESINNMLQKQAQVLDKIFNFNAMLLAHNLLPPVLIQSQNSLHLAGPNIIRLSDRIYQVHAGAHFVTTPPSWRNYLLLGYKIPETPHFTLLPRTAEERQIWDKAIQEGSKEGSIQAFEIFLDNLGHLKRDFIGMAIYHTLLAKNMITSPYVSKADLGITGNTRELRINDQVMRITATANLKPDSHDWQAVLTPTPTMHPAPKHLGLAHAHPAVPRVSRQ